MYGIAIFPLFATNFMYSLRGHTPKAFLLRTSILFYIIVKPTPSNLFSTLTLTQSLITEAYTKTLALTRNKANFLIIWLYHVSETVFRRYLARRAFKPYVMGVIRNQRSKIQRVR